MCVTLGTTAFTYFDNLIVPLFSSSPFFVTFFVKISLINKYGCRYPPLSPSLKSMEALEKRWARRLSSLPRNSNVSMAWLSESVMDGARISCPPWGGNRHKVKHRKGYVPVCWGGGGVLTYPEGSVQSHQLGLQGIQLRVQL